MTTHTKPKAKPNGWEEFECSGPYCNHERSDKHYIVGEDVLFQAILSAEEAKVREIKEKILGSDISLWEEEDKNYILDLIK